MAKLWPFEISLGMLLASEFVRLDRSWGALEGIAVAYRDARVKFNTAAGLNATFVQVIDEYKTPEKMEETTQMGIRLITLFSEIAETLDNIISALSDNPILAAEAAEFRARALLRRGVLHQKLAEKGIHPEGRTEGMILAAQSFSEARTLAEENILRLGQVLPLFENRDPIAGFQIRVLVKRLLISISSSFRGQMSLEADEGIIGAMERKRVSIRERVEELDKRNSEANGSVREAVRERFQRLNLQKLADRTAFLNMLYRLGIGSFEDDIMTELSSGDKLLREGLSEFGVSDEELSRLQTEAGQVQRQRAKEQIDEGLRLLREASLAEAIERLAKAREILVESKVADELVVVAASNHALAVRMWGDELAAKKRAFAESIISDGEILGAYEAVERVFLDLAAESPSGILPASFVGADGKERLYIDEIRTAKRGKFALLDRPDDEIEAELSIEILDRISKEELRSERGRKWLCEAIKHITGRNVREEEAFAELMKPALFKELERSLTLATIQKLRGTSYSAVNETAQREAGKRGEETGLGKVIPLRQRH
ncbi:MAG: hypothetical protein HYU98_07535 [Deltaproteobacteria bacterium]|nr:hypothetical protein [Deltaproteobacteria bacterium]